MSFSTKAFISNGIIGSKCYILRCYISVSSSLNYRLNELTTRVLNINGTCHFLFAIFVASTSAFSIFLFKKVKCGRLFIQIMFDLPFIFLLSVPAIF